MTKEEFLKDVPWKGVIYKHHNPKTKERIWIISTTFINAGDSPRDAKFIYGKIVLTPKAFVDLERKTPDAVKAFDLEREAVLNEMYQILRKEYNNDISNVNFIIESQGELS